MESPSPLHFVGIAIHALGCAALGGIVGFLTLLFSGELRVDSTCDPVLVCFFGAATGAVVSVGFSAVRLWQPSLTIKELRDRPRPASGVKSPL